MVQVQHLKDGGIERCTLHKAAPLNRTILTAVFVVVYAYTASEMYATMGMPRQEAILQQEALRIKALQEEAEEQTLPGTIGAAGTTADELEEEAVDEAESASLDLTVTLMDSESTIHRYMYRRMYVYMFM